MKNRHPISLLLYSTPLLVAVAVYGYCITLPFFLDDGPHFLILEQTDGLAHWGDFPAFPFYRPLVFSLWKMYGTLAGGYDAPLLHLVNVLCYGFSGVLIGQITRLLLSERPALRARSRSAALIAGIGFVLYPFNYQAVAMVAAFFHLLMAVGITFSLWCGLLWMRGKAQQSTLVGAWAGAFAAIFSHELGVLVVPFMAGMIWLQSFQPRQTSRRTSVLLLPILTTAGIYLGLWLAFRPSSGDGAATHALTALAVLMQGIAYPFVALIRPWVRGDSDSLPLLLYTGVVAAAVALLAARLTPSARRLVWGGLGWFILGILPPALLLPAGYVLGQPRLALLAALGAMSAWGVLLAALLHRPPRFLRDRLLHVGMLAIMGLSVWVSLEFLAMRRADFLRLRDWQHSALALFEHHQIVQTGAVLVNAPDYITPSESDRRFLLGTEGVLFMDAGLDYAQQLSINMPGSLVHTNITVIGYRQIQRSEGFGFRAHPPDLGVAEVAVVVQDTPHVIVTMFSGDHFWPEYVGGNAADENTSAETLAEFPEPGFALLTANGRFDPTRGEIITSIRWQVEQPAPIKTFVHVICEGRLIAQSDGFPWGDTYPFVFWRSGEAQTDIRTLRLPETCPSPQVFTGLYREDDLIRLRAVNSATRIHYPDDLVPVSLN